MKVLQVGIDLAEQILAFHAADKSGATITAGSKVSRKKRLGIIGAFNWM
ncbi:hypothetical protein [Derxia lacustris]|nr:hypothetical protein [Derxia lacustris]